MSAAERAKILRNLADASNRCLIALTDDEVDALEDAIALYEDGDEGEVTT